jgi:hypothetical protein
LAESEHVESYSCPIWLVRDIIFLNGLK